MRDNSKFNGREDVLALARELYIRAITSGDWNVLLSGYPTNTPDEDFKFPRDKVVVEEHQTAAVRLADICWDRACDFYHAGGLE